MKIPAQAFTHGGKFHADDVFSAALLQIVRPDVRIQRGFEVPEDFEGLVFDIGDGMFDHHAEPRETRPNGVPYAAFGKLWRVLGPGLVGENQARLLDENFIQPLDLNDNTGEQDSLADAIGSFNPRWDSKEPADECFARAVAFAKVILENRLEEARAVSRADELVQKAYANMRDGIVVLPCYAPWKNALYRSDAIFVVYPSQRGGWAAQCVNDRRTKSPKLPFPSAWAGQAAGVLAQRSGLHATFMPKPIYGISGSGMHLNMSLFRNGKNVFYSPTGERELSPEAYAFIAGLLAHVRGFTAVTNPLVNSYKRLVSGHEAPCYVAWSTSNRSALIRIPAHRREGTRVELRSPDPTCNPYLALAVTLAAGLDGIERFMTPPSEVKENLYAMDEAGRRAKGMETLPRDLNEALELMRQDKLVMDTLGEHVAQAFLRSKQAEWEAYNAHVSAWEIDKYMIAY